MSKIVSKEKNLKKALEKKTTCYVLITCSEPNSKGEMEVELSYEGDKDLAAFLVNNAMQAFDDERVSTNS